MALPIPHPFNMVLCKYYLGKLPIEADMDNVPQDLLCKPTVTPSSGSDILPLIPPKTIKFSDKCAHRDYFSDSGKRNNDHPPGKLPPLPPKTKYVYIAIS